MQKKIKTKKKMVPTPSRRTEEAEDGESHHPCRRSTLILTGHPAHRRGQTLLEEEFPTPLSSTLEVAVKQAKSDQRFTEFIIFHYVW